MHIQMHVAGPVAHVYGSAACRRPSVLYRSVHQGMEMMEWWATYELQLTNDLELHEGQPAACMLS
jgi:hypothetical protein